MRSLPTIAAGTWTPRSRFSTWFVRRFPRFPRSPNRPRINPTQPQPNPPQAAEYVRDDSVASIVSLYSDSPALQAYIVKRLYQSLSVWPALASVSQSCDSLQSNTNLPALCQVGSWAVGEFGDLINTQVDEVPIAVCYPGSVNSQLMLVGV